MPGLGTQIQPPFLDGSINENGEHTSNPMTGPPDVFGGPRTGGMVRGRLVALDGWEHALGAFKAKRGFNRGVPQDHCGDE